MTDLKSRSGHLGLDVGLEDGLIEGEAVGNSEIEGTADACPVGFADGKVEGCILGETGSAVALVGLALGRGKDGTAVTI